MRYKLNIIIFMKVEYLILSYTIKYLVFKEYRYRISYKETYIVKDINLPWDIQPANFFSSCSTFQFSISSVLKLLRFLQLQFLLVFFCTLSPHYFDFSTFVTFMSFDHNFSQNVPFYYLSDY